MSDAGGLEARGVPDIDAASPDIEGRQRAGRQHHRQTCGRIETGLRNTRRQVEIGLVVGGVDVEIEPALGIVGDVVAGGKAVRLEVDIVRRNAAAGLGPFVAGADPAELQLAGFARTDCRLEQAAQHIETSAGHGVAAAILVVAVVAIDDVTQRVPVLVEAVGAAGAGGPALAAAFVAPGNRSGPCFFRLEEVPGLLRVEEDDAADGAGTVGVGDRAACSTAASGSAPCRLRTCRLFCRSRRLRPALFG